MKRYSKGGAPMIREAIEACTLDVRTIARELRVSEVALRKYRSGERAIPAGFALQLAAVLKRHQAVTESWIRKLRAS